MEDLAESACPEDALDLKVLEVELACILFGKVDDHATAAAAAIGLVFGSFIGLVGRVVPLVGEVSRVVIVFCI